MPIRFTRRRGAAAVGAIALSALALIAADHNDAPSLASLRPSDINDVYAWHTSDSVVMAVTFGGPGMPADDATYSSDVLYTLNIDTDEDNVANHRIRFQFGQNTAGAWGVRFHDVPGVAGSYTGAVDTVLDLGPSVKAFAGLRDDPFFFDLQGFQETVAMGTVRFMNTRDFFAGRNTKCAVLEIPRATFASQTFGFWATTEIVR
ncbi:MAG TPA: DUF4331 family protein, partial [Planctomycetota bacterium]|nr:DUF4331 family protein [Planctomycetota bacterium]